MARIRNIKPEAFDDPDLNALPLVCRWLFVGLWTQADKSGRLEDDPRRIKVRLLPFDDVDIDALLATLAGAGLLLRYAVKGRKYLHVVNFEKHQRPHPREQESNLPAPPGQAGKRLSKPGKAGTSKLETEILETEILEILDVPTVPAKDPPDSRVKTFLDWFQAEYKTRRNGAAYFIQWPKDAPIVKRLLKAHAPERLQQHALVLLTTDDPWIDGTDRGIGILSNKINWLEERLATWQATHAGA